MRLDHNHLVIAKRLLGTICDSIRDVTFEEDCASVGDLWVKFKGFEKEEPVGLKWRGANNGKTGTDYNLSAWSESTGLLNEVKTAGNKLYLYWFPKLQQHQLVRMPDQSIIDDRLPSPWRWDIGMGDKKFIKIDNWNWLRSEGMFKRVVQGVHFVEDNLVTKIAIWNADEKQIF